MLQTHNVALTSSIADYIVTVGSDGVAQEVGTELSDVLADPTLAKEVEVEREETKIEEEVINEIKNDGGRADGKLILAEEVAQGRVTWKALGLYIRGLGGRAPGLFLTIFLGGLVLEQVCNMSSVWFLGQWGSQYEHHDPSEIPVF
jgi:RNA-binding protein YhbY